MTLALVAYSSKRGSTKGIAEWIGADLREAGFDVDVRSAPSVRDVTPYHVVILGGALYAGRWHRGARRFARRHARMLRGRPVWLFSSGPLDVSADEQDIPPVKGAARAAEALDARGHVTFGGRLAQDARGFPASAMAKTRAGDFRNPDRVHAWTAEVVDELRAASH
ncbi:MAG TPA: flavodoxin domain-containing protein [Streptosporangiaceae bacterium]|nr:flavodoxin domain-containing protein [Streptosporangiaceae bacterium]